MCIRPCISILNIGPGRFGTTAGTGLLPFACVFHSWSTTDYWLLEVLLVVWSFSMEGAEACGKYAAFTATALWTDRTSVSGVGIGLRYRGKASTSNWSIKSHLHIKHQMNTGIPIPIRKNRYAWCIFWIPIRYRSWRSWRAPSFLVRRATPA